MKHDTTHCKPYLFSEDGNFCSIRTANPPRHWYNYLWNEDRYCAQVSQMGHGRSYYISTKRPICVKSTGTAPAMSLSGTTTQGRCGISARAR